MISLSTAAKRALFPFSSMKPSPPRPMILGFVDEINDVRVKHGLHPLIEDPIVSHHAQEWANVMAGARKLWHGNHEMRHLRQWPERVSAENIGMGYPSAEAVVNAWMEDRSHRDNILGSDWGFVGVGLARSDDADAVPFWCCQFVG